ncbi:hypothetical protein [Candidatus Coxiella mudrowiae]|uniref:hypothetical protein n=1 Tax=Candidatus Coxiella mudrowiae TaxID=2054173 RepID=UPI0027D340BF|nr:hypothetical protein [Candidatus Coxiella mudrowiae]
MGGQIINFEPGINPVTQVSWPGFEGDFVTFSFDTLTPHKPTTALTGPWSWLHLI